MTISSVSCSLLVNKKEFFLKQDCEQDKQSMALDFKWITSVGNILSPNFGLAISGEDICISSPDGSIAKLNLFTGDMLWKILVPSKLSSGIATDGSTVIVISEDGEILAFNSDGKLKWIKRFEGGSSTPPIIGNDIVVIRTKNCHIQAFDINNGECLWKLSHPYNVSNVEIPSRMILLENFIITGIFGGKLLAINILNGDVKWEGQISDCSDSSYQDYLLDIIGTPNLINNLLCAFSLKGTVCCFDIFDRGRKIWTYELSKVLDISMDEDYVYLISENNIISALNSTDGSIVWQNKELKAKKTLTNLSVIGNTLMVSDLTGHLYTLSSKDGAIKGSFYSRKHNNFVRSSIISTTQGFLMQTENGNLMLFEGR